MKNKTITDTSRTDEREQQNSHPYNAVKSDGWEFARVLERENNALRSELSEIVAAILKRGGKDVTNMAAMDRLAELHSHESKFLDPSKTFNV